MNFGNPERFGKQWTYYEIEELKLSYRQWLLDTAKKHGRTVVSIEYQIGAKKCDT